VLKYAQFIKKNEELAMPKRNIVITYTCDICHHEHTTEEKALACEARGLAVPEFKRYEVVKLVFPPPDSRDMIVSSGFRFNVKNGTKMIISDNARARDDIPTKDIQDACAGAIYALNDVFTDMTSTLGRGGPQLAIGAEVLSKHIDPSQADVYGLFGDGAGALVIDMVEDKQDVESKIQFHLGGDGYFQQDLLIPAGGTVHPTSLQTLKDGMHCLQMNGPVIKTQAIKRMVESVEIVTKAANLKPGDISLFIPHQANREIIIETAKLLNFPIERVYININRYGNTSAASIPLAMHDAYYEGRLKPDEMIVIASLGAGVSYGAATLPTTGLPKRSSVSVLRSRVERILPPR